MLLAQVEDMLWKNIVCGHVVRLSLCIHTESGVINSRGEGCAQATLVLAVPSF